MKLKYVIGGALAVAAVGLAPGLIFPSPGNSRSPIDAAVREPKPAATHRVESVSSPTRFPKMKPAPPPAEEFDAILGLNDSAEKKRLLDGFFSDWTSRDAAGAAGFVLTVGNEDLRKECILRVMQTWAAQAPKAALSWAQQAAFATPPEREMAMCMACTQVSRSDPQRALGLASDFHLDESAEGLVEGLTTRWAEDDLPAAREWAVSQPAGFLRDSLIESLALVLLADDPVEAARLVLSQTPAGEAQNKTIVDLVSQMALEKPDEAQRWVESFPQGPLRDRAWEQLARVRNQQPIAAESGR